MSKDLIPKMTLATSRRTFLYRSAVMLGGALLGGPLLPPTKSVASPSPR
jgi:hypothetical protein